MKRCVLCREPIWSQDSSHRRRLHRRWHNLPEDRSAAARFGYWRPHQQCRHVVRVSRVPQLFARRQRLLHATHALQHPLRDGHDTPLVAQNGRKAQRSHPERVVCFSRPSVAAADHVLQLQGNSTRSFMWQLEIGKNKFEMSMES